LVIETYYLQSSGQVSGVSGQGQPIARQTLSWQIPSPHKSLHISRSSGHGANSQFGEIRPTADPSGQILASIVQPTSGFLNHFGAKRPIITKIKTATEPSIILLNLLIVTLLIL